MQDFPIAKFEAISTPFYYYNLELLKETADQLKKEADKYGYIVHYALKANSNHKILRMLSSYGFGADCVSGNEIKKALETGFYNHHIAFAGVGKSDEEIKLALEKEIFSFNCESLEEMKVIDELAGKAGKKAKIAIRFNPNVNAKTHHYITTGLEENKFGINRWELDDVLQLLKELKNIELKGLHFHIGSQITEMNVFRSLCLRVNEIQNWFKERNVEVEHINVGGGLGVDYGSPDNQSIPDFKSYFAIFYQYLELLPNQSLHFELGRAVVAQCGSLISRALYIKKGLSTNFIILDAGMTELIRPALYQSSHKIENLSNSKSSEKEKYDVVGPICESSDCFGKAIELPLSKRMDIFAIRSAGAYGEVMSSNYNLRDNAKTIYSDEL